MQHSNSFSEAMKSLPRDLFKNVICINDVVAFNPPKYKGLLKGVVVAITEQKVRIRYQDHTNSECETYVFHKDVVRDGRPGDLISKLVFR